MIVDVYKAKLLEFGYAVEDLFPEWYCEYLNTTEYYDTVVFFSTITEINRYLKTDFKTWISRRNRHHRNNDLELCVWCNIVPYSVPLSLQHVQHGAKFFSHMVNALVENHKTNCKNLPISYVNLFEMRA
jgi:hypothetical protein